jgi:NAD(P)-dependent dehydrogenase (short-subunit alcohol dehydrogenase family)
MIVASEYAAWMPQARTCLITGAGRGIGREAAVRLASAGHRVALVARSEKELVDTAAACGGGVVIPLDLTAPGAVDDVFARTEAALGPVEVLIAAAGVAASAPLARTTDEEWQRIIDLNLTTPFRCVRRAVPAMTAAGWGRIVVIASIAGRVGAPYIAAYAASKHGVLGLVRPAAAELVKSGVTVNAICPAYVDTRMTDASVANIAAKTGRSLPEARRALEHQQPIGRLITVEEVASAVMFCVENGAVTGQAINVDGGTVQS